MTLLARTPTGSMSGKLFVTSQYTKQGFPYVIGKTPKSFHGLSTFLAELVVFDIGKVEISHYYLTRLRTEKSKYHTYNSRHTGPS